MFRLVQPMMVSWAIAFSMCLSTCRASKQAYFTLTEDELGKRDYLVANGNPMKGLITNPEFHYDPTLDAIDSSMDCYYVPVGKVMHDDPDVVGFERAFNWSYVEERIDASTAKNRHVVLTFAVHYPGDPLSLPRHLEGSDEVPLHPYGEFIGGGLSPDYGSEPLLRALSNFVVALGEKYDADNRVAFIHLGLLGFWGEWHTFPLAGLVPDHAKARITEDFRKSFNTTKLQARYPDSALDGFGYYDGSFAYTTLDGDANGGVVNKEWYFWPMVQNEGHDTFWRTAPMGGETRPEIQHEIFEDTYPRGTYKKQDFDQSVRVTHATYIMHPNAFIEGGYNGKELENALRGHVMLGYNFVVTSVAAIERNGMSGVVDIEVTIEQDGVAPFYYELALLLNCAELPSVRRLGGLQDLIDRGSTATFTVRDVPATALCLDSVEISLDSPMLLPGRPMKFSQGEGVLKVSLPLPAEQEQTVPDEEPVGADQEGDLTIQPPPIASTNQPLTSQPVEDTQASVKNENEGISVEFYYLASKTNGTEEWLPIRNGDTVNAPDFGLSFEVRPDQSVSSIWFTYGADMWIENITPYILRSNDYLTTSGSKSIIITVFVGDVTALATTVNFDVVAAQGQPGTMPNPAAPEKLSITGQMRDKVMQESHPDTSTVHGYNTPFAPSLLQLIALDKASAGDTREQVPLEAVYSNWDNQPQDEETWSVSAVSLASNCVYVMLGFLMLL